MKLTYASSPHIRGSFSTRRIMADVVLALMPALAVGAIVHGARALIVVLCTVVSAIVSESIYCLMFRKRFTVIDGSSAVTGVLLGMTLPVSVPLWQAAIGSTFAVIVIKLLCGVLGQNIFNPALSARA